MLVRINKQPKEIAKLNALIQSEGTDADKWQMNLMNEIGFEPISELTSERNLALYKEYLHLVKQLDNHYFIANIHFVFGEYYDLVGLKNESFQNKAEEEFSTSKKTSGRHKLLTIKIVQK